MVPNSAGTTVKLGRRHAAKARVVQHVGRLLRTRAGKHHDELHDYIDVRIAVLDRMHATRLPAYATLGFDIA